MLTENTQAKTYDNRSSSTTTQTDLSQHTLYTPKEVAEILRVSPRTLDTLIAMKEIIPLRVGKQRRFTKESVEDYIRNAKRG